MDAAEEVPHGEETNTHTGKNAIPLSKETLSWGVELEFVFAFHESQLDLAGIPDFSGDEDVTHPTILRKKLLYHFRRYTENFKNAVLWEYLPDRVYNSWGLYNEGRFTGKLKPYGTEVEQVLRRLLEAKYPSIGMRVEESLPINEKEEKMYNEWLIMRDHSVCGVGSQNIPTWLPRVKSTTEWDSYGLELVSPKYSTDSNQGFDEIAQMLRATKGTPSDKTGAFITNQCGLHVHVQAPTDLIVLKELAVLVIVYESEISKLHPQCRRPDNLNARYSIESNRLYFLHQDREDRTRHTYGNLDVSNEALARQSDDFLNTIREQINACSDAKELALLMNWPNHDLGNELGNRSRQVNFTAAVRPPNAPYTIEFRQARGTLDANDVQKWVEFCICLVRLAQFYVDNPGRFPMKSFKSFSVDEEGEAVTERFYIMDLMRDMGMSEEDKEYWRVRMARFAARGGPLDREDNEKEPEEGEEGMGIPGDGGDDDSDDHSGNRPSGGNGNGNNSESGASGGRNSGGNNGGSSGEGGAPPPPPSNGGKKPSPKTGDKRPADDDDEEEYENDQGGPSSKKQKNNGGGMRNNSDGGPAGGDSRGDKSEGNQTGGKESSPKTGDKRPAEDDDEDDEDQARSGSKKQKTGSQTQGGENEDNSQAGQPQVPRGGLATMATNFAIVLGYIAGYVAPFTADLFASTLPAAPAPVIPPDYERPTEGMIAPNGIFSPGEAHVFQTVTWNVQGFHTRNWNRQETSYRIGRRSYVCAVNALLQSMRSQYPNSPYGLVTAPQLLAMFDEVAGREVYNDEEDNEVAAVMERWTGGDFRAVIVSSANDHRTAYRAGDLDQQVGYGRNLYVRHRVSSGGRTGHWEGMERRATPREDPPPGSSSRPSGENLEWFRY